MVPVEGLKRPGNEVNAGKVYQPRRCWPWSRTRSQLQRERPQGIRQGLSNLYPTMENNGRPGLLADWASLGKGDRDRFSFPDDDTTSSKLRSGTPHLTACINPMQHR